MYKLFFIILIVFFPSSLLADQKAKEKKIAKYKMPEDLRVVDDLPKNPVGKVLRRELKDLFI